MESEIKRELREDDKGTEEDKPMSVDKLIPIICTYLDNSVKYYQADKEDITSHMTRLSEHKNLNHAKLIQYIKKELNILKPDMFYSLTMFKKITKLLNDNKVRKEIIIDFFKAFQSFWKEQPGLVTLEIKNRALESHNQVLSCFLADYIKFFYEQSYAQKENKQLVREFWDLLNQKDYTRALKLLIGFRLLKSIDKQLLLGTLVEQKCSLLNFDFFFSEYQEIKTAIAKKLEKRDPKLCGQFVKKYKLNQKDFPQMMWQLQKNALNYVIRQNTYYYSQEKFRHDDRYLSYLALRMKDKQPFWAQSLIVKYNLYDCPVFDWQRCREEVENIRSRSSKVRIFKNILVEKDDFGATELRVLGQPTDYMQLMDLRLKQSDVYFIDEIDRQFEMCRQELSKTQDIGFDCEFSGGWTKFNPPVLELIQLATIPRVYLLDFQKLSKRNQLKELITDLYVSNRTNNMVGFGVSDDTASLSQYIGISKDKFKPVIDLQNLYKKDKSMISLKNLVLQKLGKQFSKYQQCSAWNLRPLRRAQKHYAALDARVLLELLHIYRR